SALGEFVDALGFVRRQPRLQDLIFFVILVTFFGLAVLSIMPAVASQMMQGGADTLGLLLAMSGAGALVATVALVPIAQSARKTGLVVSGAVIWMGVCFVAVSFSSGLLPLALLGVFCFSLGAPVVITMALGLLQVLAPAGMRARILSLFVMVSFGMQPIASLLIGYSASALGTPLAIRINGIGLILGGLAVLFTRSGLRQWEANRAVAAAESGRG
ncbi:MAG: MFS transporter, partial [Chloroflexi bacterium]|nr:MFS transporter [Chloroflexota bacterium]